MSSITFVDYQTVIPASWLNDVNALVYNGTIQASTLTLTNLVVNTSVSGAGFTAYMASPPAIGSVAASSGAFTDLSSSGVVGGAGFVSYLASPPVIGGTAANAGSFTTLNASGQVTFSSTGAMLIPKGTSGQQPSGTAGMLRFNTTTSQFEGYNGSAWASVGGAAISNDTSTGTARYPIFANATSGTALTVYTSNAKYLYTPATGMLQAPQMVAGNGIFLNMNTISTSVNVLSNQNAGSFGPVSVANGATVTVYDGSVWTVV